MLPDALLQPYLHLCLHHPLDDGHVLPLWQHPLPYQPYLLVEERPRLRLEFEPLDLPVADVDYRLRSVDELLEQHGEVAALLRLAVVVGAQLRLVPLLQVLLDPIERLEGPPQTHEQELQDLEGHRVLAGEQDGRLGL